MHHTSHQCVAKQGQPQSAHCGVGFVEVEGRKKWIHWEGGLLWVKWFRFHWFEDQLQIFSFRHVGFLSERFQLLVITVSLHLFIFLLRITTYLFYLFYNIYISGFWGFLFLTEKEPFDSFESCIYNTSQKKYIDIRQFCKHLLSYSHELSVRPLVTQNALPHPCPLTRLPSTFAVFSIWSCNCGEYDDNFLVLANR